MSKERSKNKKTHSLGAESYRHGALERLAEAFLLLRAEKLAGGVYLAGRAVEGMLRAIIWRAEPEVQQGKKSLETGHDLRLLLTKVRNLGLLRHGDRNDELDEQVQHVGRLWFNNLRFAPAKFLEKYWANVGEIGRKRSLKRASNDFYDACSAIIRRCDALYQKSNSGRPSPGD